MWRPSDWNNPYDNWARATRDVYEAGADAMLEALGKEGVRTETITSFDGAVRVVGNVDKLFPPDSKGYLVFIPDEEE